jgi:uncharacterized protein (TIGR01777 family)
LKIVIPGGTGHLGTILASAFHANGHAVLVLGRRPTPVPWQVERWDGQRVGEWARHVDGCDVVINLAGRSVNCRYTEQHKREILESRLASTRAVGEAIARASRPPRVWLQASTATIYAHRHDRANDEATGVIGQHAPAPKAWGFSVDVARAWEREAETAPAPHTRKVLLRAAMVMSPEAGGIFDTLLGLVRRGLGGQAGNGRQFVSWVHERDFVRAIEWLIERDDINGPVIIASPNPLPNREFMRTLRETAGVTIGLPAAVWILELGAVFMRTETELLLKSRRVVPGRLLAHGFTFEFPEWREASKELYARRMPKDRPGA